MADGKNLYETVIVTSAKLGEEGSAALVERFKALIAEHGTVQSVDDWGKRRFAYPIQKQTEGYYTLINFESTPDFTAELDRRYQITDGILRTLIVKRDPRHVMAIEKAKKAQAQKAEEANNIDVEAIAAEAVEAPAQETAE
ncbi:MAG TPA: 30S ribosomal protein S6 [Candidatus Acutalibacter stercorigallinarum]|nr:30S ribosomal protein S6 [Candidatus Acutalibacter stercorigallinarum]